MTKRQWYSILGAFMFAIVGFVNAYFASQAKLTAPSTDPVVVSTPPHTDATSTVSTVATSTTTVITNPLVGPTNAVVVHVMDGDTIEALVDGQTKPIKVRFLGVNTPESVDPRRPVECFGKEASHFTKQLLEGTRVLLKEDLQADDLDKYGRSLRNIFLADGTDVNALLVKEGYAYEYTSFPQTKARKAELKRLQAEAKAAERGLWNPTTCDGMK